MTRYGNSLNNKRVRKVRECDVWLVVGIKETITRKAL